MQLTKSGSLSRSFSLALTAVFLVTTVAAALAFFWTASGISNEYTRRFALSQNELEKNRILSQVDREVALGLKLVDDPVVQAWMADEGDSLAERRARDQLASYRRLFRDHSWFVAVAATGSYYVQPGTGDPVRTRLTPGKPEDRWFFESLTLDKPYWINLDYNVYLDKVKVWINILVKDPTGRVLGVAGTALDLADFLGQLVDHREPGLWSVIVNAQGDVLAHPDRTLTDRNARVSQDSDRIKALALVDAGDQGVLRGLMTSAHAGTPAAQALTYRGTRVVATSGYLPDLGWYNLVLVDPSRVLGYATFLPVALVFLGSLVLFLVAVRWLLGRWVLAPLGALNRASDAVASGTWNVRVPVTSANELGRLGDSFNQMAAKIQVHTEDLEALVAARTRDLEASQARLVDSIAYSKLIQGALLPSEDERRALTGGSVLLLEPLDTVGGDFCFFRPIPGGFCVAAVDCTGHGVPGAFMTMLVHGLLNQVIAEGPADAAAVLTRLDQLVQDNLRSGAGTAHLQNGLDIGLCLVHADEGWLDFAGAGLPLVVARPGNPDPEVTEWPGTKTHLGFTSSRAKAPVVGHRLDWKPGFRYYLFTDGLWDWPSGTRGFGLGRRGVVDLVRAVHGLPWNAQEGAIREALGAHRGPAAPKDDVLLFGFCAPGEEN